MMDMKALQSLPIEIAISLEAGFRLWQFGQLDAAQAQLQTALARAEADECVAGVLGARHLLGSLAYEQGEIATSWRHHTYVLERSRCLDLRLGVASSLHNLGLLAAREHDMSAARTLLEAAIATYEEIDRPESAAAVRANMARLDGLTLAVGRVAGSEAAA